MPQNGDEMKARIKITVRVEFFGGPCDGQRAKFTGEVLEPGYFYPMAFHHGRYVHFDPTALIPAYRSGAVLLKWVSP